MIRGRPDYSFPCSWCDEFYPYDGPTFLYNSDYRSHSGPLCKNCVDSLPIPQEEKDKMLQDRWDWNFCSQELSGKIVKLLNQASKLNQNK